MHEVGGDLGTPVSAEVAPDGARQRSGRIRRACQGPKALDHSLPLGHHGHDRPGQHELDERLVERLANVLGVVLCQQFRGCLPHLEGDDRVSLGLDTTQNLADTAPGDTVRLDQNQRALGRGGTHADQPSQTLPEPDRRVEMHDADLTR